MKRVILKGLNKRGKNRVAAHGSEFIMTQDERPTQWGKRTAHFESVKESFRLGDKLVPWGGWLDIGTEVEIVEEIG